MNKFVLCAGLVAFASACGGGGTPRQFVVVGSEPSAWGDGSNGKCPVTEDPNTTSTNFQTDQVLTIYQGDADAWYLDVDGQTLKGTYDSGTYTFSGESKTDDTEPSLDQKMTEEVDDQTVTVTLTINGSDVSGNVSSEATAKCTNVGADSNACQNAGLPTFEGERNSDNGPIDCVDSSTWKGTELPQPQFQDSATNSSSSSGTNF